MPLISFIIPFYNRLDLLKRALQNVLSADFNGIEIILVDDASTGRNVADELSAFIKHKNIIYLRQPENRGPGAARNRGLNAAGGEWIFFMDSDDVIYPKILVEIARFLTEARDCDIVVLAKTMFRRPNGDFQIQQFADGTREGVVDSFLRGQILNFPLYSFYWLQKAFMLRRF
ncbi:MAG: glycosyltransferase family 2 protein [Spirochaetaceae bacterium]|jgi:glycosyltransferase involved in cell wall biosynthesis|nr:glycosyltransferase family 2 protein [Spirochaetaceae bacterium]